MDGKRRVAGRRDAWGGRAEGDAGRRGAARGDQTGALDGWPLKGMVGGPIHQESLNYRTKPMLQTVYIACPRGHYYRAGRMTPGLVVRVRGTCPACRDYQITSGVVTPFSPEIMQLRAPHLLTAVPASEVRLALSALIEHTDVARTLRRIPTDPAHLSVHDVLLALEAWMRHRGHAGGILPERNQEVEVLGGTRDPAASIAYLRDHRCGTPESRYGTRTESSGHPHLDRVSDYAETLRDRIPSLVESVGRELRRLPLRLNRS